MAQPGEKKDSDIFLSPRDVIARWNDVIKFKTLSNWRATPGKGPKFKRFGNRIGYRLDWVKQFEGNKGFSSTEDYEKKDS